MEAVPTVMKAAEYKKYDRKLPDGLELVEVPVPKPRPTEILLKVHASSVNPVDWKLRKIKTSFLGYLALNLPPIPGFDMAGTVAAIGSDVTEYKVGDRLVAATGFKTAGALAEYAVIDLSNPKESAVARLHESVCFKEAAGFPVAALTPYQGLIKAGFAGKGRVLVQGASGGVGHYAVQLAKIAGAHVTATAGTSNLEFVKSLGADEVLDYKKVSDPHHPFQSASGEPYEVILQCTYQMAPWSHYQKVLAPQGKVVNFTPRPVGYVRSTWQSMTGSSQRLIQVICQPSSKELQAVADLMAEKKLRTVIDSTYPLSRAKEAWQKSIDGHSVGKIIVIAS